MSVPRFKWIKIFKVKLFLFRFLLVWLERPTKQNEIQPFYNNQKFEPTVNNDFNYQNNQNFALPNNKINSSFGNQQQSIEYPKNDGNFNKNTNYQNNPLPQEDPNLITKVIKKEYGEFLKNQVKMFF